LRDAYQLDLQELVHKDMKQAFTSYPAIWGLSRPDRNIDHRRVPNLETYFTRQGYALDINENPEHYLPGDLVTCRVGNRPHMMVVSDQASDTGKPLIIHNIGRSTQEEDRLFTFSITGHYRATAPDILDTKY